MASVSSSPVNFSCNGHTMDSAVAGFSSAMHEYEEPAVWERR
jgi:hypothetical protein